MSSPPKVKTETRAGHPPAVKAGGMRIVQKHPHAVVDAKEDKDKDDQEWESSSRVQSGLRTMWSPPPSNVKGQSCIASMVEGWLSMRSICPPKPTVFISGVIARGDKDFPPAAAQVAHQKPHPSVEKLPPPQHVNQYIHQPRK